jgi:hypothetical protein
MESGASTNRPKRKATRRSSRAVSWLLTRLESIPCRARAENSQKAQSEFAIIVFLLRLAQSLDREGSDSTAASKKHCPRRTIESSRAAVEQ